MKPPIVVSRKSDIIMIVLFVTVVSGLVGKGFYSMSNQSIVVSEFLNQENNVMSQEAE